MPKKSRKPAATPADKKPKQKKADKPPTVIKAIDKVATLKDLRKAAQRTQDELAEIMGMGQGAISRIEKRDDMLVSTLQHYVESLGGTFQILATFPDRPPLIVERLGKKDKAGNPPRSPERKSTGANGHAHAL
ncbi:MAG: helix-turn-helix transcriptional regulator [Burkholderiaceae bacterium]